MPRCVSRLALAEERCNLLQLPSICSFLRCRSRRIFARFSSRDPLAGPRGPLGRAAWAAALATGCGAHLARAAASAAPPATPAVAAGTGCFLPR